MSDDSPKYELPAGHLLRVVGASNGRDPSRPVQTRWHRAAPPDCLGLRIRTVLEAKRYGLPIAAVPWCEFVPVGRA